MVADYTGTTVHKYTILNIGSTESPFLKKRNYNHKSDMNIESRRNNTELSKHVWWLKETNAPVTIKWRIAEQAKGYSNVSKRCSLCVTEKFRVITADRSTRLNKRSELISKCRHANKFQLSRVTWWTTKYMSHARLGVAVLPVGAGEVAVGAGFRGAREWWALPLAHALWRILASVAGFPMPWRVWESPPCLAWVIPTTQSPSPFFYHPRSQFDV